MVIKTQRRRSRVGMVLACASAAWLAGAAWGDGGLEVGQEASAFASLPGYGGGSGVGYSSHAPGLFGAGPGPVTASGVQGSSVSSMSYSVSGLAHANPIGPAGSPIRLRAAATLNVNVTGDWGGLGTGAWQLGSIATTADRFTVPWVADGSTSVTMTWEGRISGVQSRVNDLGWASAYLIGNPGLGSQSTIWQNVLSDGPGPNDANFNNVPFAFSTVIGVDPWGWVAGLRLIAGAGWVGGSSVGSGASSDFASTVVVDRLVFRSGRTGAILSPSEFTLSTQSGLDYSAWIVPSPGAGGALALMAAMGLRRRR
jgi:hypothetical protein